MPSTEQHPPTSAQPAGDARDAASAGPARADGGLELVLRTIDVLLVALSAPVAILLGAPAWGIVLAAVAWALQRGVQEMADTRARRAPDGRRTATILGVSMLVRFWFVAVVILVCGLAISDADGAAACIVVLAAFTVHLGIALTNRHPHSESSSA